MEAEHPCPFSTLFIPLFLCLLLSFSLPVHSDDAAVMELLKQGIINSDSLGWSGPDPCTWKNVKCDRSKQVQVIQIKGMNLQGTLPKELRDLPALTQLEVQQNQFTGPFPSFAGHGSILIIIAHNNRFTSFPADFFTGMTTLQSLTIGDNPFSPWTIPESIVSATSLKTFSASSANLTGKIPEVFGTMVSLGELKLAMNKLEGELPQTFARSSIQTLWLNGQQGNNKLNGTIVVLADMASLTSVWLHGNQFTGPIPDFSMVKKLQDVSFRDNQLTGIVPASFVNLPNLRTVSLTNNLLQGPRPTFGVNVDLDMKPGSNRFCTENSGGTCDGRVNDLLSVVEAFGYPKTLAEDWRGNDPCNKWKGITCTGEVAIEYVDFQNMGLSGTISPKFSLFTSMLRLVLSDNNLTGTIPSELTKLPNLELLDVSNNNLHGKIPSFINVLVITNGNPDIGKESGEPSPPGSVDGSKVGKIVGAVVGSVGVLLLVVAVGFCLLRLKQKGSGKLRSPHTVVIHPRHSGDQDAVKITVAGGNVNCGANDAFSPRRNGPVPGDIHFVEAGSMVISIQVLKNVTNNFSGANILGWGGFGTVYKGELHDGTKIAVKRMESGAVGEKGQTEFMSEISVLTKVRHRHLVALLGYCLDGKERLLVYEYMPQGTLSKRLFNWREARLKPLEWTRRLTIALDVARGVEYLHGLAHQSFIHRDLKPSNILLGDDMRAKVSDFGLVRLAPEGNFSVETRLAGTFGYLAPEYAVRWQSFGIYAEQGRMRQEVGSHDFRNIFL
ncbi:receptor protein kinase TMK1-like isoform X2 [Juglans regia]|uniref:non-specific serine/threonine protein kinase n=1 Tax=Juglans regia TaxID=51240 RepID=A0A6P9DXW8_JUGRE|nr:receptor protein kinase TMK1-like isoform X2 [Juglans regia]